MAKELNNELHQRNYKVIIFWALILAITALFAVLFVVRVLNKRMIDSYEDINREHLSLTIDITTEEGMYYVYMYSAKKDDKGKLVNTAKTDISKANDVFPTVLNYFNYVKRKSVKMNGNSNLYKIYGYNVNNKENDSNLDLANVKLSQLPVLVLVDGSRGTVDEVYKEANNIQEELSKIMNK